MRQRRETRQPPRFPAEVSRQTWAAKRDPAAPISRDLVIGMEATRPDSTTVVFDPTRISHPWLLPGYAISASFMKKIA